MAKRQIIEIDLNKLQVLRLSTFSEAGCFSLDYEGQFEFNSVRIWYNKTAYKKAINQLRKAYEEWGIQLWGNANLESDEQADFEYLESLVK